MAKITREGALAIYAMATQIVAARIASGKLNDVGNLDVAVAIQGLAQTMASGIKPLDAYFDPLHHP